MITARRVILDGLTWYNKGRSLESCPHKAPDRPLFEDVTHVQPSGVIIRVRVRVAIDLRALWQRGWKLGEFLKERQSGSIETR